MGKVKLHDEVLEQAMEWANVNKQDSSIEHKAAFANAVAFLVSGLSGGYGGPSVREHAVSRACALQGRGKEGAVLQSEIGALQSYHPDPEFLRAGEWSFEEAVKFAEPVVFGPITDLHRWCWENEHCFDDDSDDVRELTKE